MRASLGVVLFIAGLSLLVETYALPNSVTDVVGTTTAGFILAVCGLGALAASLLVGAQQARTVERGKATAD